MVRCCFLTVVVDWLILNFQMMLPWSTKLDKPVFCEIRLPAYVTNIPSIHPQNSWDEVQMKEREFCAVEASFYLLSMYCDNESTRLHWNDAMILATSELHSAHYESLRDDTSDTWEWHMRWTTSTHVTDHQPLCSVQPFDNVDERSLWVNTPKRDTVHDHVSMTK